MDNFFILVLKFILFYSFFFFFGRALISIFFKKENSQDLDKVKVFGIEIYIFYPVLGVIFLGNILFLFNFLLPIKSNYFYIFYFLLLINFKYKLNINNLKRTLYFSSIFIPLIMSSYEVGFHYDAGLYHLNNQLWLRESNIILGFANIYSVFGVSSIFEYISALLWIEKSFILLHFLNLLFIGFLYKVVIYTTLYTKNEKLKIGFLMLLLFSFMDNFGFSGGRNGFISIQSIGKQDMPIAIIFLILSIFILNSLFNKTFKKNELLIVSFFTLFLFQLKISSFPILFLYFSYLYFFIKNQNIKVILKVISPVLFIATFWILKTVVHTGCIIFPLSVTCFDNFYWVDIGYIKAVEDISVSYSNSYYFDEPFISWVKTYFENPFNRSIAFNFLISLGLLIILNLRKLKNELTIVNNIIVILFILFSTFFYLRFGPDTRYIVGFQMFLIVIIGFYSKIKINVNSKVIFVAILFSAALLPRLQTYLNFNIYIAPNLNIPIPVMSEFDGRYIPKDGDQCWINLQCSANRSSFDINKNNFFKVAYLVNN